MTATRIRRTRGVKRVVAWVSLGLPPLFWAGNFIVSRAVRDLTAPELSRCATRCVSVLILPEPAPAMTNSSGETATPAETPVPCVTACPSASVRRDR